MQAVLLLLSAPLSTDNVAAAVAALAAAAANRPSAKTSKGCGTVQFAQRASALAALQALHGSRAFERAEAPLVVEPLDPRKQKQAPPPGMHMLKRSAPEKQQVNSQIVISSIQSAIMFM
jgi:hypothetical protein